MDALMRRLKKPKNGTSWTWNHFRKYPEAMIIQDALRKKLAICTICLQERIEKHEDEVAIE